LLDPSWVETLDAPLRFNEKVYVAIATEMFPSSKIAEFQEFFKTFEADPFSFSKLSQINVVGIPKDPRLNLLSSLHRRLFNEVRMKAVSSEILVSASESGERLTKAVKPHVTPTIEVGHCAKTAPEALPGLIQTLKNLSEKEKVNALKMVGSLHGLRVIRDIPLVPREKGPSSVSQKKKRDTPKEKPTPKIKTSWKLDAGYQNLESERKAIASKMREPGQKDNLPALKIEHDQKLAEMKKLKATLSPPKPKA